MSETPPHLADIHEYEDANTPIQHRGKIGPQGPSKYGAGGRRAAKAKGKKKR